MLGGNQLPSIVSENYYHQVMQQTKCMLGIQFIPKISSLEQGGSIHVSNKNPMHFPNLTCLEQLEHPFGWRLILFSLPAPAPSPQSPNIPL
jgi:hypothetical protein